MDISEWHMDSWNERPNMMQYECMRSLNLDIATSRCVRFRFADDTNTKCLAAKEGNEARRNQCNDPRAARDRSQISEAAGAADRADHRV